MPSPPRSWEWTVEEDAGFHCRVDKRVQLTSSGLSYRGDGSHPNRGGPYAIGFQTVAAFLAEGELSGDLPAEIAAAIRVHLEALVGLALRTLGGALAPDLTTLALNRDARRLLRRSGSSPSLGGRCAAPPAELRHLRQAERGILRDIRLGDPARGVRSSARWGSSLSALFGAARTCRRAILRARRCTRSFGITSRRFSPSASGPMHRCHAS